MRTLKKSLALVLAIVLVVGVCAFQVAAFTDDEDISHDEAVAVLTGIGVIKGRDTGAFDPAATLTRAEAATIITRLKGQEDLQAKSKFDDMQGHWAESYVAYCAAEGIVNGVGDNKFDPDAKLTGNQWGKMLLVAMGYDPAETGLDKGDTWEVAVAKLVKEKKLKAGVETLDMNAPISREDTCVLAFNGLGQSVSGNKTYVASDGETFDTPLDAALYAFATGNTISVDTPSDSLQANFPTLSEDASYVDEFGRPGRQWSYGDPAEPIYTEVEATEISYTAKDNATISMANINKALGRKTAKTMLTAASDIEVLYNGEAATLNVDSYVAGDLVEVYAEKLEAKTVVITHYELAAVTAVTELKASEITEDDPSTVKIDLELPGSAKMTGIHDANFPGFAYAKGDYILVAKDSTNAILASEPAELIVGKITGSKGGTAWTINGATYGVAPTVITTNWVAPALKQEATWALDTAGRLGAVVVVEDEAIASTDYALIYNVVPTTSGGTSLNEDGMPDATTTEYMVYAVLADGTKMSAIAWADKDGVVQSDISGFTVSKPIVRAYEIKEDGAFKIVDGAYNVVKKDGASLNKTNKVDTDAYAVSNTNFILSAWESATSYKVTVMTGFNNVVLTSADIQYVVNPKTKIVSAVFAASGISAVDTSEPVPSVAVMVDPVPTESMDEEDNDKTIYTYTVIIDGAEAALVSDTQVTIPEGAIFEYETVSDKLDPASVKVHDDSEKVTVEFVNGDQVNAGGKLYSQAGAKVYAFDEDGAVVAGELAPDQTALLLTTTKSGTTYILYAFIDYAP